MRQRIRQRTDSFLQGLDREPHPRHANSSWAWPNAGDPGTAVPGKQPDTVRNEVTDQAHKRTCAQLGTRSD